MKQLRLLPVALTVVCLCAVLRYVDLRQTTTLLSSVRFSTFALLCAVAIVSRLVRAIKWNLLLRSQQLEITPGTAIRLNWIGSFFAFWTPAGLGSDAYRIAALANFRRSPAVVSTLFVERYIGLLSVFVVWLLTLPFTFSFLWQASWQVAVLLFATLVVCLALLPWLIKPAPLRRISPRYFQRVQDWLQRFLRQLSLYRRSPVELAIFCVLSLIEVISYVGINFLAARSIGIEASFVFFLCAMPPVYLVLRLPISIQGWGFQEGAMGYALSVGGFDPAAGVAISLIQRAVELLCFVLPGALLAAWYPVGLRVNAVDEEPSTI